LGSIILGVFEQGMIFAIMAMGIYITYSILDFPDLTADGSFPLGGAVTAALMTGGISGIRIFELFIPMYILALPIAFLIGMLAGIATGIIHVKFKIRDLISGIIVMTGLFTINLRIAGAANVPIFRLENLFENPFVSRLFSGVLQPYTNVVLIFLAVILCKTALDAYLKTKSGLILRAVGDNSQFVTTLAVDKGNVKILGLAIANGLIALSGSLMTQWQRVFDLQQGTGTMVIGLASVIIGMSFTKQLSFLKATSGAVIGSILYRACIAIAIQLGLSANDLKLITAVLLFVILVLSQSKKKKVNANA